MGNSYTNTSQGVPAGGHDPKTNWTKIAAILSAAASAVAVLTWLGISGNNPRPNPVPTIAPQATVPGRTGSAPDLARLTGLSAVCQQAEAAVTGFNDAAGMTWAGRADAAMRAYDQLGAIMSSGAMISQLLSSDLLVLINDFRNLYTAAMDGGGPHCPKVKGDLTLCGVVWGSLVAT
jgi:hypothetical protein